MPIELSKQQLDELRNAKREAEDALTDIDKAERAGLDMKEQKAKLVAQLTQINNMLSVYG